MATTNRHRYYEPQDWWDKFWKDSRGKIVIWQRPNSLLIAWIGFTLVSLFAPRGSAESIFWWASQAALGGWSLLEITRGVNYFRRLLGAVVLVIVLLAVLKLI